MMNVLNILKAKGNQVFSVHVDAVLGDVVTLLNEKKIGAAIVLNHANEIEGIISERDIIRCSAKTTANIKGLAVRDVMTPKEKLIIAHESDMIDTLMNSMTISKIRHIPILGKNNDLVGMISIGDVVKAVISSKEHEIAELRNYIENKYPN
jgi:CBS domain-containing protein